MTNNFSTHSCIWLWLAIHEAQISLIILGPDSQNVYKTVWNIMNQTMLDLDRSGIVGIGSCSCHMCRKTFVMIDLHQWFELSAAREEDYGNVEHAFVMPENKFLRHKSRMLSIFTLGIGCSGRIHYLASISCRLSYSSSRRWTSNQSAVWSAIISFLWFADSSQLICLTISYRDMYVL